MQWDPATQRFFYRVAGVVAHGSKVLCHKDNRENFWVLPGGSCEFGEDSQTCLEREFQEELGASVSVGRLLWVVENFFELGGKRCHELGFYYEVSLKGESRALAQKDDFLGFEAFPRLEEHAAPFDVLFRWIPLTSLSTYDIRPAFLRSELLTLPAVTRHLVHRDRAR